jgi:hypothetical protein
LTTLWIARVRLKKGDPLGWWWVRVVLQQTTPSKADTFCEITPSRATGIEVAWDDEHLLANARLPNFWGSIDIHVDELSLP